MKWAILLVLVVLISGCVDVKEIITKPPEPIFEGGIINLEPETFECEEKLTRRSYKEDGSYEEICLEPEELKLERCYNDEDCSEIEECKKGFCELVYSLVIDETT